MTLGTTLQSAGDSSTGENRLAALSANKSNGVAIGVLVW